MIYGKLHDLPNYMGIHKNLDTAIRFLQEHNWDISFLQPGRNEVDGDNVFVNAFSYTTTNVEELTFEAHKTYADIHILRSGTERIAVSPFSAVEEFERNLDNDYIGLRGEVRSLTIMDPTDFMIVLPEDPHMTKVKVDEPCLVEKAVMKVKID